MSEELNRMIESIADAVGIVDKEFLGIARRVRHAIESEFPGSEKDGGIGIGFADYGIEVDGVIYDIKLSVRGASTRSKN